MGAKAKIQELRKQGKRGVEIARVLLEQGCAIGMALAGFRDEGYVASIEPFCKDVDELHVSDSPMEAGWATVLMAAESRCLPSVVWSKEPPF